MEKLIKWAMAAFVVIFVLVLVAQMYQCGNASGQKAGAEQQMKETAATLWPGETITALCQAIDTDGNGYVSCTVVHNGKTEAMECPTLLGGLINSGCRVMKPTFRNGE